MPLNVLLARPEVDERMRISGARLLVEDAGFFDSELEPMPDIVDCGASDPAVILFTSGTSGRAKGAVLTHGGIRFAAQAAAHALGLTPDDVVLGAAPFSHVLGQSTGLVGTLSAGASIAVVERFDAEATLRFMSDTSTTILLGVPTMCIALCEAARTVAALPPVRIAHIGGAPVPLEVARDFEETFGGEVVEGYGLTELSGIATTYVPGQSRKPGSVGMPLEGTELRIAGGDGNALPANEPGEIEFRGPSVIPGYWEDEESTAEALSADGWLSTGDIGYVDEDGYLFLVDRKKDVIIRGGYNVYPREVEEVLYAPSGRPRGRGRRRPAPDAGRRSCSARGRPPGRVPEPTISARMRATAWPRTSIRDGCCWWTRSRRARPGRSSSARSTSRRC